MSYIEEIASPGNTVVYCGGNDGTIMHVPGKIALRYNPGSGFINSLQFASTGPVGETFEAYSVVRYGNGARQGFNFKNIDRPLASGTWYSFDDGVINDGSDINYVVITPTNTADPRLWQITSWRPTPTKCVIIATFDSGEMTVNGTPGDLLSEMHRISVSDSTTVTTSFNGKSYLASDGWIPEVAGHSLYGSLYTGHGAVWSIVRSSGEWGLFVDATGISVCSHVLDVIFRKYPPGVIRRFGNFT